MMVNPLRGEISAKLDGKPYTLCLTLGALATLESELGAENLSELSNRFAKGTLSSNDLIKILWAGLNGAGNAINQDEVAAMKVEGGLKAYVGIAARLLEATFTPLDEGQA